MDHDVIHKHLYGEIEDRFSFVNLRALIAPALIFIATGSLVTVFATHNS